MSGLKCWTSTDSSVVRVVSAETNADFQRQLILCCPILFQQCNYFKKFQTSFAAIKPVVLYMMFTR